MLNTNTLVTRLESKQKRLNGEVYRAFSTQGEAIGNAKWERWREELETFLSEHLPDEVRKFRSTSNEPSIIHRMLRSPQDFFWEKHGQLADAYRKTLIHDLKKGRVKMPTPKKIEKVLNAIAPKKPSNKIFVVHGHDKEMRLAVKGTLKDLGLKPIILHEQHDGGRTIIEKIEQHGDVGFAVVLLSPDDMGYKKADGAKAAKPRARQNVVLELGYFAGRLGRGKVMALKRGDDLEVPSDYDGVVYTTFDDHEGWQKKLVQELRAAGYNVNANALLPVSD